MVRSNLLTLKTDEVTSELINADINDLNLVVERLFDHATKLNGLAFCTSFPSWVAPFAAMWRMIGSIGKAYGVGHNYMHDNYKYGRRNGYQCPMVHVQER